MSGQRIGGALLMFFVLGGVGLMLGGPVIGFVGGIAGLLVGLAVSPGGPTKKDS